MRAVAGAVAISALLLLLAGSAAGSSLAVTDVGALDPLRGSDNHGCSGGPPPPQCAALNIVCILATFTSNGTIVTIGCAVL